MKVGDVAPVFCLPDAEKGEVCLDDMKGGWVVLYFYPRDKPRGAPWRPWSPP